MKLRIATFNVENLFRRSAILNLKDSNRIDELLDLVRRLQVLLSRQNYTVELKEEVSVITQGLRGFIDFRRDSGTLGSWEDDKSKGFRINKGCTGRKAWLGEMVFTADEFSDQQRKNTGKVIKTMNADILCLVEVEGMDVLRSFNSQVLTSKKYKQYVMIDSPNDTRGIDVACLTRGRIANVRTHVFDAGEMFDPVFSRDCLEVTIEIPGINHPIFALCNHFKSQGGGTPKKSADKRKDQSTTVAKILKNYDLTKDYVVVLGDLNEDSDNAYKSLTPLFNVSNLLPLIDPNLPAKERYTHYYKGGNVGERLNQLDYIFLSKPLHGAIIDKGIERRGIFDISKIAAKEGAAPETSFKEVTSWDLGASDHAGLWVEVEL